MKPAPFEYFAPETTDEVLDLLGRFGGDGRVLAGGQSLMPLLNFRLARPAALVDINRVGRLSYVQPRNGWVAVGAGARQAAVLASPEVQRACPLLTGALSHVGHVATRNRGTVCGSIAHADPAAEMGIVATALDAQMVARSVRGERVLGPDAFFVSHLTTALEPDELLAEVRFPTLGPRTGWGFFEVSRRHGDFGIVAVAAVVTLDGGGACASVRVALGGVDGRPVRARALERALVGTPGTGKALHDATHLVLESIEPGADVQATAEYRKHLAAVLTRRAVEVAVERAGAR